MLQPIKSEESNDQIKPVDPQVKGVGVRDSLASLQSYASKTGGSGPTPLNRRSSVHSKAPNQEDVQKSG